MAEKSNANLVDELYQYFLSRWPTDDEAQADQYNMAHRGFDSVVATLRYRLTTDNDTMAADIVTLYVEYLERAPGPSELASEIENWPKYGRNQLVQNLRERAGNTPGQGE